MIKFRDRFPDRRSMFLVLAICALPVNIWSWVLMLNKVPSLLLNWSPLQIIEVLAYTQSFALLDIFFLFGILLMLSFLLPASVMRDRFISQSTLIAFSLSIWAAGTHWIIRAYVRSESSEWNHFLFAGWSLICLILLTMLSAAIRQWPVLEKWLIDRVDQANLLAMLFISINVLSLLFIIVRNLPVW